MDNRLKRVSSNPGPSKVIFTNPNAKPSNAIANGSDSIANNKLGSAPLLHNKINSDQLLSVPSRNKVTDNPTAPAAPKKEANRHTMELDSKKLISPKPNNRSVSTGPISPLVNIQLPPVAPRKVASVSPPGSGEFAAAARDAKANNSAQASVPPPTAPRKVGVAVESGPPKVSPVPPPTAPRNIPSTPTDPRPLSMSPSTTRHALTVDSRPASTSPSLPRNKPAAVPPPTAPRNIQSTEQRPMSPLPTRNTPNNRPETPPPAPPALRDSTPKLTVLLTSPQNSNDSDKSPLPPREGNVPPPVAPRVNATQIQTTTEELPTVPSRNLPVSNNSATTRPMSPVLGRNNPAAAAKKSSNPSTPSSSGEFVIPKSNSGPTIPRVNTPPPVAPRTTGDAPLNPTTVIDQPPTVLPPVAPRKVGERVATTEETDQPTKIGSNPNLVQPAVPKKSSEAGTESVAAHSHGVLASSMPTRSQPHTELRSSTPITTPDNKKVPLSAPSKLSSSPVVVVQTSQPKGPPPAPPKVRAEPENVGAVPKEPPPATKESTETTDKEDGTKLTGPRPKSAPIKVPVIQANVQRKTVDDSLSPRSVISPRSKSPPLLSPRSIQTNQQSVPAILINEEPKPQPASFTYSKPLVSLPLGGTDQGVTRYTKNVRPPTPPLEDDALDQEDQGVSHYSKNAQPPNPPEDDTQDVKDQGITRYSKNVRPPSPREDDDGPTGLAPPDTDTKRISVEVDIDPISLTLSPRTLQQKIQEVDEGFFYNGLDYYLDPENQPDFASDFQEARSNGPTNSNGTNDAKEARKSAWVKVTKPKSIISPRDILTPDLAKARGTIDPDELPTRPVSVMIANRNINDNEPPEEDSGNENDAPPGDVPADPKEDETDENKLAMKAKKDLKKIQKFFTKVIPKKLGINKDKEDKDGDSSDSSSDSEGKQRPKTVAFEDPTLTPEEREERRKQQEEEERLRREEKERRKQEKERLKREQKEREEKEKEERDKIKLAEKEEKDRLKREEKEKEDKEKEERDKIKQAEKEKEKERLKKEKEEREAKEREEREKEAANKPAAAPVANFKVDKKAPNIAKILPKLSEDDGNRLNHATVDRPAFKGRRPPTRVLRPGIVTSEGDNEIDGQAAPTPATPMEF